MVARRLVSGAHPDAAWRGLESWKKVRLRDYETTNSLRPQEYSMSPGLPHSGTRSSFVHTPIEARQVRHPRCGASREGLR
jgi:hypothetical protein